MLIEVVVSEAVVLSECIRSRNRELRGGGHGRHRGG